MISVVSDRRAASDGPRGTRRFPEPVSPGALAARVDARRSSPPPLGGRACSGVSARANNTPGPGVCAAVLRKLRNRKVKQNTMARAPRTSVYRSGGAGVIAEVFGPEAEKRKKDRAKRKRRHNRVVAGAGGRIRFTDAGRSQNAIRLTARKPDAVSAESIGLTRRGRRGEVYICRRVVNGVNFGGERVAGRGS